MATDAATPTDPYPTRDDAGRLGELPRLDPVVWPGEPSGPLTPAELDRYRRRGFLTAERLLMPGEITTYLTELHALRGDPALRDDERAVREPDSEEIRSVFEVHEISRPLAQLAHDPRLVARARQILGSEVYIHQTRVNYKPGYGGNGFYWHSDFETWHSEDGMPRMRALSVSIALTDNLPSNGPLMIMPGSHQAFVPCAGRTPPDHHRASLRRQEIGTPGPADVRRLADRHGIEQIIGPAGSATFFDSNCMHGSNGNITPYERANVFIVYNSVENTLVEPYAAPARRPEHIASRSFVPVG
ncbi:ectoine hydroxylase [Yinghuangia sp. YIM S09857]|uniref:ectoine hydroxylase n=1 Tax=Yinghuangia sp. YIM S09857 TaxID=3436929 RepID=UPI003F537222